jgi:hypothetical protein
MTSPLASGNLSKPFITADPGDDIAFVVDDQAEGGPAVYHIVRRTGNGVAVQFVGRAVIRADPKGATRDRPS